MGLKLPISESLKLFFRYKKKIAVIFENTNYITGPLGIKFKEKSL